jgi:hypothetical protein
VVGELGGRLDGADVVGEQRPLDVLGGVVEDAARGREVGHHGAAVEGDDARLPQQAVQVGVVARPEEARGMLAQDLPVDVFQDADLVVPADGGEDGPDVGVAEDVLDVGRPCCGVLGQPVVRFAGGRELDWFEAELLAERP